MPKAQSNTKKIPAKKETRKSGTGKPSTNKVTITKRKSEFINKFSKTQPTAYTTTISKRISNNGRKIHTGVRIFFGCSLFLFCIAVYYAILRPQFIETSNQKKLETVISNNPSNEEPNQNRENVAPSLLEESF
ncbi:MAG: hypothetical protein LBI53_04180 [Candidatus Peribacteria bacterium]|jgi:hypothetical protein|nr:hypothetical protein [Candidatus Peribacteria bacterium]